MSDGSGNNALLFTEGVVRDTSAVVLEKRLAPAPSPARADGNHAGAIEIKGKNWEQIHASALAAVMEDVEGSRAEAVRQLGIDRKTLLKMLREYNLESVGLKGGEDRS